MTDNDWKKIVHFNKRENWGNPKKMDFELLSTLDKFRSGIDFAFSVTSGWAKDGHSPNSYHYKGQAVDGRFYKHGHALDLKETIVLALLSPFNGVGIYNWSWAPFVHFDVRKTDKRVIWVSEREGEYDYDPRIISWFFERAFKGEI